MISVSAASVPSRANHILVPFSHPHNNLQKYSDCPERFNNLFLTCVRIMVEMRAVSVANVQTSFQTRKQILVKTIGSKVVIMLKLWPSQCSYSIPFEINHFNHIYNFFFSLQKKGFMSKCLALHCLSPSSWVAAIQKYIWDTSLYIIWIATETQCGGSHS